MKNITNLLNSLLGKSEFTFNSKSCLEPGFTAVVLKDNQVVWQKCHGWADLNRQIQITPKTNFRLASLSKQFTAMAIMILKKNRQLNFDDPLKRFIPDFPDYGKSVTIRQLLTHTSGIPDHEKVLYREIQSGDEPTMIEALEVLKSRPAPLFLPGSKYQYSDAGYVLLALIIEKASGFSYREFLKQNVFTPLQMNDSDVLDQTKPKIRNRALGYKKLPNNKFRLFDYDPLNYIVGDEGVYSSIDDMAKWATAWNEGILVSKKTLKTVFQPQKLSNGQFGKAGFSWLIEKDLNRFRLKAGMTKVIYQDGSWVGFRNIILKVPEQKLSVIILSNRTDLNTERQRVSLAYKLAQKFV